CVAAQGWASTVPYRDCANCVPPYQTIAAMPRGGIIIQVTNARERPPFGALGGWPPRLRASQVVAGFEGEPTSIGDIQLYVQGQDGVDHSLFVWFGTAHPTAVQLARATAELQTVRP